MILHTFCPNPTYMLANILLLCLVQYPCLLRSYQLGPPMVNLADGKIPPQDPFQSCSFQMGGSGRRTTPCECHWSIKAAGAAWQESEAVDSCDRENPWLLAFEPQACPLGTGLLQTKMATRKLSRFLEEALNERDRIHRQSASSSVIRFREHRSSRLCFMACLACPHAGLKTTGALKKVER